MEFVAWRGSAIIGSHRPDTFYWETAIAIPIALGVSTLLWPAANPRASLALLVRPSAEPRPLDRVDLQRRATLYVLAGIATTFAAAGFVASIIALTRCEQGVCGGTFDHLFVLVGLVAALSLLPALVLVRWALRYEPGAIGDDPR